MKRDTGHRRRSGGTRSEDEKLALSGGPPVRSRPLPPCQPGAQMIGAEERTELLEVLDAKALSRHEGWDPDSKVATFERAFAERMDAPWAMATSSGTGALRCALVALGVGPGDEVVLPAISALSPVEAVVAARATPIFAEVDRTLNLSPKDLALKFTARTRAVVVTHLRGVPAAMDEILDVAKARGVAVIEEAGQAIGATFKGKPAGTLGDVGCFTLHPYAVLTAGEGGVLVARDPAVFERAIRYGDHGRFRRKDLPAVRSQEDEPFLGDNLHMAELPAAVALAQIRKLDRILERLRMIRDQVKKTLWSLGPVEFRQLPDPKGDIGLAVAFFLKAPREARAVIQALEAENCAAPQPFDGDPVYLQTLVLQRRMVLSQGCPFNCTLSAPVPSYYKGLCPKSEELLARSVWIPITTGYTDEDIADLLMAIRKVWKGLDLSGKK